jgi:hypothetical protein
VKSKIAFVLISMIIFLFGCAPIAKTATETPVPPTATATSTATATETATPTATEDSPTYNVCPPETTDPAECTIDVKKDLLSGNYAVWYAETQVKPFLSNLLIFEKSKSIN